MFSVKAKYIFVKLKRWKISSANFFSVLPEQLLWQIFFNYCSIASFRKWHLLPDYHTEVLSFSQFCCCCSLLSILIYCCNISAVVLVLQSVLYWWKRPIVFITHDNNSYFKLIARNFLFRKMILREKMLKKRYLYLLEEKCFMLRIVGQSALFCKEAPLFSPLLFSNFVHSSQFFVYSPWLIKPRLCSHPY